MERDPDRTWRWQIIGLVGVVAVSVAVATAWCLHASPINHWLAVHTGTVDESGPYYGFWSGFGSDIAEFGILGAVGTAIYQQVKKYNCHQPGCWRVGTHPAAGGQFVLCYRHHPEYAGKKPTGDLIERLHRDHVAHQNAIHNKLQDIHEHVRPDGRHDGPPDSAAAASPAIRQPLVVAPGGPNT
jgi:hypothetical protein